MKTLSCPTADDISLYSDVSLSPDADPSVLHTALPAIRMHHIPSDATHYTPSISYNANIYPTLCIPEDVLHVVPLPTDKETYPIHNISAYLSVSRICIHYCLSNTAAICSLFPYDYIA